MKAHKSLAMTDTIKDQYARYRAQQLSRLRTKDTQRPSHVPPHLWNTFDMNSRAHIRDDGLPILNITEYRYLMGIDLLDGDRGYKTQPEPGIPEEDADIGAIVINRPVVDTIRALMSGNPKGVSQLYRKRAPEIIALAPKARFQWICDNWDLRPEWVNEILTKKLDFDFVFGDLP